MKRICVLALVVIGALLLVEAPSWGKDIASCGSNSRHPVTRCHVAHRNLGVETADASQQRKRRPNLLSIPVPRPANRLRDIPAAKGSLRQLKDFSRGQSRDRWGDKGQALSACLTCPSLVQGFTEPTLLAHQKLRTARLVDSSAPGEKASRGSRQMDYYNNSYGMIVGGNVYERIDHTVYSPGFDNSRFYYGSDPDPRIVFELHRDPSYARASSSQVR
jgi:hypothetical protein